MHNSVTRHCPGRQPLRQQSSQSSDPRGCSLTTKMTPEHRSQVRYPSDAQIAQSASAISPNSDPHVRPGGHAPTPAGGTHCAQAPGLLLSHPARDLLVFHSPEDPPQFGGARAGQQPGSQVPHCHGAGPRISGWWRCADQACPEGPTVQGERSESASDPWTVGGDLLGAGASWA
jgi:hypothetical protein